MRTTHTRIADAFGGGSTVIEHVQLSDLVSAWTDALAGSGIDPQRPDATEALSRFLSFANVVRLSTWGDVYRAEHARVDLPRHLAQLGVEFGSASEDRPTGAPLH